MRALRFGRVGSLSALTLAELPTPDIAADEVLVAVRAAGVNPSDYKNVLGAFPYTTLPRTPGRDFAGLIVDGPADLVGLAVWGTGAELGFTRDGSHAELVVLPRAAVCPRPRALDEVAAAQCGVPFVTAWDALERADLAAGETLLVIGAAGAVGQAALQLGRLRGARLVGAVRAAEQQPMVAATGARPFVLTDAAALGSAMAPRRADVVFDTTGHWLGPAVAALAIGGRLIAIAAPPSGHVDFPVLELYRHGASLIGVNSLLHQSVAAARILRRLAVAFEDGTLAPPPRATARPLADAVAVYHEYAAGKIAGRVVLYP